ncbi:MAG TPA: hypothetical protein VHG29_12870 [Novosphingobium sp.]|nr:hypothetical protein [Novosphingobium sp.]
MMQLLFRNRWLALMWVVVSLISIGSYFGEGGGHEKVDRASAQLRAQQAEMQKDDGGHSFVIDADSDGFSSEEELVDGADPDEEKDAQPKPQPTQEIADTYVLVDNRPSAPAPAQP